ncbi:hypothetical protein KEM52_005483, partial [Ascosphaera acerosa]
ELRTGRGGPNSIDNFARSWHRAAGFLSPNPQFVPERRASIVEREDEQHGPAETMPLLRSGPTAAAADHDDDSDDGAYAGDHDDTYEHLGPSLRKISSQAAASYSTSVGSRYSVASEIARQRAAELQRSQAAVAGTPSSGAAAATDSASAPAPLVGGDQAAISVKAVQREDGTKATVVVGHSTLPQTVFNSVNTLIGIGMLSLPLAFQYSGWLLGMAMMVAYAGATIYTAELLAKCLDVDASLATYADLAYVSFGPRGRLVVSVLFCTELFGAAVASVVLFADSLDALVPNYGVLVWKILCGAMLVPLSFVPLHLLSLTSILGIFSCTALLVILVIDGLLKHQAPGSLLEPASTFWLPANWNAVPLSIGLMLAPWGGHGVFPNIYKDMRHPQKYSKSLVYTFGFTWSIDTLMGVVGWLMFGENVRDEVTSNILLSDAYPATLSLAIVALIAVIPLTKVPLGCRPVVATIVGLLGLRPDLDGSHRLSEKTRSLFVALIRVATVCSFTFVAIIFPSFDRIMALMGASLCMVVCITFPIAFHLRIFGHTLSLFEWAMNWFILIAGSILGVVGTVYAFLPTEKLLH